MIICLLSCLLLPLQGFTSTLKREKINSDSSGKALCNDHTAAQFYTDHETQKSSKWVIYLESGGGCSTREKCIKRYGSSKILMSSTWLEDFEEIQGLDILSSDKENPFSDYNHVYLPYCSSDMYVGMNEKPDSDFSEKDGNFLFNGYNIVQGLIKKIVDIPGVTVSEIILAGSSAGGIGVVNHIKITKKKYSNIRIRGIVDSSWFINFEDNFLQFWDSTSAEQLTGFKSFPSTGSDESKKVCSFEYGGMPCCFRADCMEHHGAFKDLELLFILSKHDIYLLQNSLMRSLEPPGEEGFDAIALAHVADIAASYSGAMMLSVNSTKNFKLSYYVTSCLQHVYLAPSSFWSPGQPLNDLDEKGFAEYYEALKNLDLETFPIKFNQAIRPRTMYTVTVGPPEYPKKTLSEVITQWAADSSKMIYIQDGCVGIDCNPNCPDQLDFVYTSDSWSDTVNITIMAILGTITLVCLVWKVVMMIMLSWLQGQQRNSLGMFATESFIPALGPSDMMSVSCVDLSHSVTYVIDKEESEGSSGTSFKKLENDLEGNGPLLGNGKVPNLITKPSKLSVLSNQLNKKTRKKQILNKVSVYFNPSSFVGIMGPSGCGKTTFLDVVTGRREVSSHQRAKILIDGQDFDGMKEEFTRMLAYVLQLERPYHEALTVRENLTFEALMRLPKDCPLSTVFNRVETVLQECGLDKIADAVVGGDAGGGISGGQKRKLCVALQLIDYPSIIFLDEPTSGLDSTSSYELMAMLSKLQVSKRCIVLTIHQPRQEIFHLFTHILLLVGGQVAFYGSPLKAYGILETALKKNNVEIKDFVGDADIKNEADLLMDMLNNEDAQKIMINYYEETELDNVKEIIAKTKILSPFNKETITSKKKMQEAGGFIRTVLALESRIMLQQTLFQILYLPLIFLFVPLVLGYVYHKANQAILIISVYCVVTCMGPLFMTSIIMNLINDTLRVFLMQYKDGIGCLYHVVFMVFYRLVGITTCPMLLCSVTIYFLVNRDIDFWTFLQVTVILIALCQAWMGVFSAVVYAGPTVALKICPMVSALSAFTSGFLVPEPKMPPPFNVLFSINPTFWAIKAISKLLLKDKMFGCKEYTSNLSCQISSGNFNLDAFGFIDGDPVVTGFTLLGFIVLTQLFSVWVLLFKHSPDSMYTLFVKWISNLKCSISLPRIFSNGKVADGELVIIRTKDIEPRKEWAKVIGKVIKQQQETFTAEIEAGRIIESSFLEGIGHFLYRRGTNSETILESHNRNYRNQNGVTDEMLERIILILRNGLKPSEPKVGDRRASSLPGNGDKGTYKIKNQAELQVHQMLLANRKRQFQCKFKAAGNSVRNANRLNSDGIEISERGGLTPTGSTTPSGREPGNTASYLHPTKLPLQVTQSLPTPRQYSHEDPLFPLAEDREGDRPEDKLDETTYPERRGSAFAELGSSRRGSTEPGQNDQFKSIIRNLKPRSERSDQVEDYEEHRLSDVMEASVSESQILAASSSTSPDPDLITDTEYVTLV